MPPRFTTPTVPASVAVPLTLVRSAVLPCTSTMYKLAAAKTRLPLTVSVPTELPGASEDHRRAHGAVAAERAAEIDEHRRGRDRAVHAQGAGIDEGRPGIRVHGGEDGPA